MGSEKYASQLDMDLYYYKCIHQMQPVKILMSFHLWSALASSEEIQAYYDMKPSVQSLVYKGIPVQVFLSGNFEYYLASSGFVFEEEE